MRKIASLLALTAILLIPAFALAQSSGGPCSPTYTGTELCNAIPTFGGLGVNSLQSLIMAIFTWLSTLIATLALVMLIYSGARMVFSQGDLGAVKEAKTSFAYAVIGFVVTVFGYVIVSTFQYFIGVRGGNPAAETGFFYNPLRDTRLFANPGTQLPNFIESTVTNFLGLIGTVVLFYLIWNGFRYVMAGSNEDQVKSSKNAITWSVIGLACILLSYTIVSVLVDQFGSR
jgi:hypothetical protein